MKRQRLFVAVEVDSDVRARLVEVQRILATSGANVKWVEFENIHLTLKFIGEVDATVTHKIGEIVGEAARQVPPFSYSVDGLGTFPEKGPPRVVWAGVGKGAEPLVRLFQLLNRSLVSYGVAFERRRFVPHITLGRVRSKTGGSSLRSAVEQFADRHFGIVDVDRVLLFESRLTKSGPIYTPVATFDLSE